MKKFLVLCACALGIFSASSVYSQGCDSPCNDSGQATGECYCKYVYYQPCPYTTTTCVPEQIPCPRRCCRYVPQYYQVQCCRYVPEYYAVTKCRQVPEYYNVCDYKTVYRKVCVPQCRYIPRSYWKHTCAQECAPACNTGCGCN